MILEIATFSINEGRESDFESAFVKAREVISQAKGHRSNELLKSHESATTYVLLVRWDTVDDHVVGFRESELFLQWRALLQPFFQQPPVVGHYFRTEASG